MEHDLSLAPRWKEAGRDSRPLSGASRQEKPSASKWSWTLGKLFGIDLQIHATFLILLAWVVATHISAGHGVRGTLEGLLLVLSVFGIVVMHELSHALTARRFGIRTKNIMLLPIGGVANLERMPEKPKQELLVAIAGPALNVVLALLLAAFIVWRGGSLSASSLDVVGGSFLTKLMWINLWLAMFNLLPAFPMDGGRVLRAALALKMDYARATAAAARIGQGMALLFGLLGLFSNPMLLVIALFVWMGAKQESTLIQLKSVMKGIPIRDAMITDFKTVSSEDSLAFVVEKILAGFQHEFPVVENDRVVGLLTRADVVKGLAHGGGSVTVREVMTKEFERMDPSEMLEKAFDRMQARRGSTIIVSQDDRALGLLTSENIGELVTMEKAMIGA